MRTYQRYSVVAREGGHGNGLSVVVQGSLLRWVSPARGMLVVGGAPPPRELGPGSVFGEEVLLGDAPTPTPASTPPPAPQRGGGGILSKVFVKGEGYATETLFEKEPLKNCYPL